MKIVAFIVLQLFLLSGCATKLSQSNLYWGQYSQTLYKVKKEPSTASKLAHENELKAIVKKSLEMHIKVPPGVYAELGMYAIDRGESSTAQSYFKMEQDTYPEGKVLMKRVLKNKQNDS